MILAYLVRGNETLELVNQKELPDSIELTSRIYLKGDSGSNNIHYVEFCCAGPKSLKNARLLSGIRGGIELGHDVRLLTDDASAYFGRRLFASISEFERLLRSAITIASCADASNFDNEQFIQLDRLSLESLRGILFSDRNFTTTVKTKIKGMKDVLVRDLQKLIDEADIHTIWDDLFGDHLPYTFRAFDALKAYRNDVAHFHIIDSDSFEDADRLFSKAISELKSYCGSELGGEAFTVEKEAGARNAATRLGTMYQDAWERVQADSLARSGLAASAVPLVEQNRLASELAQSVSKTIDDAMTSTGLARSVGDALSHLSSSNLKAYSSLDEMLANSSFGKVEEVCSALDASSKYPDLSCAVKGISNDNLSRMADLGKGVQSPLIDSVKLVDRKDD